MIFHSRQKSTSINTISTAAKEVNLAAVFFACIAV